MFESLRTLFSSHENQIQYKLDLVMSIEGQISRAEARTLMDLAEKTPAGTMIVEIGSYRGRSTIALAYGSLRGSGNRVYAIDPHSDFQGVLGYHFGPEDQEAFNHNLARSGAGNVVSVLNVQSDAASRAWSGRNIGLLWIDGDHYEDTVRSDYQSWAPFVVDGGIVAFHDNALPGVERLIRKLTQANEIVSLGVIEALSWFRLTGVGNA